MAHDDRPIIIKRIKKKSHGGHHGGAWKVAYADFVTAMMAFFLVLWLVAMLSVQTRQAVALYFRSYSLFQGTASSGGGAPIAFLPGGPIQLEEAVGDIMAGEAFQKSIQLKLSDVIEEQLASMKDQILMIVTKDGIRLELVEKYGRPMFLPGKAGLTQDGLDVLGILGLALRDTGIKLAIEGHTDASGYTDPMSEYSNWELAADRANVARRALLNAGIKPENVTSISSFADVRPYNELDRADPINRRVSLLLIFDK